MVYRNTKDANSWKSFIEKESLTLEQQQQFSKYLAMIIQTNKKFNITRIVSVPDILTYHFQDSLMLRNYFDLSSLKSLADVGSGGGFPGIPLAIVNKKQKFFLIEVTEKKIIFLKDVISELGLKNVEVVHYDWLTFLRMAPSPVDMFLARASLKIKDLKKMFGATSRYKKSSLAYWASKDWKPEKDELKLIYKTESYKVGNRLRKLVFFKKQK